MLCVFEQSKYSVLLENKCCFLAISLQAWNLYLESAAIVWTEGCDYDADFNLPAPSYNLRYVSEADFPLAQVVLELFNQTDYYYGVSMN